MEREDAFDQKKITGRTDPAGPLFIRGDHGRSGKPEDPAGDHTGERPCAEAPAPDGAVRIFLNTRGTDREVGVRYMQAWEEKIYDRMEGIAIGRERGLREGRENGLREGRQ